MTSSGRALRGVGAVAAALVMLACASDPDTEESRPADDSTTTTRVATPTADEEGTLLVSTTTTVAAAADGEPSPTIEHPPFDAPLAASVVESVRAVLPDAMADIPSNGLDGVLDQACLIAVDRTRSGATVDEAVARELALVPGDPATDDRALVHLVAIHRYFNLGGCGDEVGPITAALVALSNEIFAVS